MPYVIASIWYPLNKADEVGKKYLEAMEKFPEDESIGKTIVPAAVTTTKEGVKAMVITEVKEEKLFDATTRSGNFYAEFRSIEGYNYKIRVWSTVEEALAVIGM